MLRSAKWHVVASNALTPPLYPDEEFRRDQKLWRNPTRVRPFS
jgi:hypothetical protein